MLSLWKNECQRVSPEVAGVFLMLKSMESVALAPTPRQGGGGVLGPNYARMCVSKTEGHNVLFQL